MTLILSLTLAPPRMAANGRSGDSSSSREHRQLALHQQSRVRRQQLGDTHRARVRAVGGPEGVVDVQVGVRRERRRERRVVRLLLGMEAQVLEQHDLARSHPLEGVLRADAEGVAGHRHVPPQQLGQALADRPQPEAVGDLAVGPAEVAGQDHLRARPGRGR